MAKNTDSKKTKTDKTVTPAKKNSKKAREAANKAAAEKIIAEIRAQVEKVAREADEGDEGALEAVAQKIMRVPGVTATDCKVIAATCRDMALAADSDHQRLALRRNALALEKAAEIFKTMAENNSKAAAEKAAKKASKKTDEYTNTEAIISVLPSVRTATEQGQARAMIGATIEAFEAAGKDISALKVAYAALQTGSKQTAKQVKTNVAAALAALAPKAPKAPKAVKAVKPSPKPVDKAMRADTLIQEFKSTKMLTSEQAADILNLEGTFRRQAAVAALTQVVKAGKAVKDNSTGVTIYKAV